MMGCIGLPKLMYPVPDGTTGEWNWGRTGTGDVATDAGVAVCGVAATGEATGDAVCGVVGMCWSNGVTGVVAVAVAVAIAATGGGNGRDGVVIANLEAITSATLSRAAGGTVMT